MREREWARVSVGFANAIERYYEDHGRGPDDSAVRSTVETNTVLVPRRGDALLRLVADLGGPQSLGGLRVLEVGSGFGALAGYLAWSGNVESLLGVDIRQDYVQAAEVAAEALELAPGRLGFVEADMRDLGALEQGPFDLVILNNSLIYVATKRGMKTATREAYSQTSPGGHVAVYQANRWTWREPFTGAPAVHFLPPFLGRAVARAGGFDHNIGRVRYLSPVGLRRRLKSAGYRKVRSGAPGPQGVRTGRASRTASFIAAVGCRPNP